jgi:transcriptional regulator with XRE-family HTH domain
MQVAEAISFMVKKRSAKKASATPAPHGPRKGVQIVIDCDYEDGPEAALAIENAQLILAVHLKIPRHKIEVKHVGKGSIILTLELPSNAAVRLLRAYETKGSELRKSLESINVTAVQGAAPTTVVRLSREIRRRREALGLSLEHLAESSRLTPNYIGTIENGKRDPSLSTVLALARGLRVHPSELFGEVMGLSSPALEAARLFDATPPEIQQAVLQILRSVTKMPRARSQRRMIDAESIRETG